VAVFNEMRLTVRVYTANEVFPEVHVVERRQYLDAITGIELYVL
jgi:hypothetical protein